MRSLSATEKLTPSPWLPSRRVVSYISTSGFIGSRQHGKENFYAKNGSVANPTFLPDRSRCEAAATGWKEHPPNAYPSAWVKHPIEGILWLMCTKRVTSA